MLDFSNISAKYNQLCITPSDINEHLPTLKKYAEQCNSIVEFGVRDGCSTYGLLAGRPKLMASYDINPPSFSVPDLQQACSETTIYSFHQVDVTKLSTLHQVDLLFIDTLHTYGQLYFELFNFGFRIRKFIIMHDTYTFGLSDEVPTSTTKHGLLLAITEFCEAYPNWVVQEAYTNNNGLTVLRNTDSDVTITRAMYGEKDVTEIVQETVNKENTFIANNALFGDPAFGMVKKFTCDYLYRQKKVEVTVIENDIVVIPLNCSDRVGVYYTDNTNPSIISKTLLNLANILNHVSLDILVCSHRPISDCPFANILSLWSERKACTLYTQILQLLYAVAKLNKNCRFVSLLEHDVLYPKDYFDYPDFSTNVLHNTNYMGISLQCFQQFNGSFAPLSQMTFKLDFAIIHFESLLKAALSGEQSHWIEPIQETLSSYMTQSPSLHINIYPSWTGHAAYFTDCDVLQTAGWGNHADLISRLGID